MAKPDTKPNTPPAPKAEHKLEKPDHGPKVVLVEEDGGEEDGGEPSPPHPNEHAYAPVPAAAQTPGNETSRANWPDHVAAKFQIADDGDGEGDGDGDGDGGGGETPAPTEIVADVGALIDLEVGGVVTPPEGEPIPEGIDLHFMVDGGVIHLLTDAGVIETAVLDVAFADLTPALEDAGVFEPAPADILVNDALAVLIQTTDLNEYALGNFVLTNEGQVTFDFVLLA